MVARALSLAALLATGCVVQPTQALVCPARGGPPWIAVSGSHVRVRTDLPSRDALRILADVEDAYEVLDQVLRAELPAVEPPIERLELIVFRRAADAYVLHGTDGFFFVNLVGWERTPTIITHDDGRDVARALLRHELTHRLIAHYLPTAPPWLNEGLAQLYSSVRRGEDHAIVGAWRNDFDFTDYQPSTRELFVAENAEFSRRVGYYNEAAVLVHLLESERRGHRPQFLRYLERLAAGVRADVAWAESFGAPDFDALDRAVNAYRFVMRADTRAVPVRPPQRIEPRVQPLSEADVHLLWIELRGARGRQAEEDLVQARRAAPGSAEVERWTAIVRSVQRHLDEAREAATRAIALAPRNPRALVAALAVRAGDPKALRHRLREVAETAVEVGFSVDGFTQEDLALLQRAVALDASFVAAWSGIADVATVLEQPVLRAVALQRAAWLEPADGELLEWLLIAARAAKRSGGLPPLVGELRPPPSAPHARLPLTGRVVDATSGIPVRGCVHAAVRGDWTLVRTDDEGRFVLPFRSGPVVVTVLPDDERLVPDHFERTVPPGRAAVDLGVFPVLAGTLPDVRTQTAYDGIAPSSRDGKAVIERVGNGSPADRAGLRSGDALVGINGRSVIELGTNAINVLLAGDPGTPVEVAVRPRGETAVRTVTLALAPLER